MRISEVSADTVKSWGRIEMDADDGDIEKLIMPAAISQIMSYTGLSFEALEEREEITMAYVALCVFLYDNRSMNIINDRQNQVIQSFLDGHRVNLL